MAVHNKLVRDNIPAIIVGKGGSATTRVLSDEEYVASLRQKLLEEVDEFLQDHNSEELADIMEVVHALGRTLGVEPAELEAIRAKKANERGGFSERIFLIDTEDEKPAHADLQK